MTNAAYYFLGEASSLMQAPDSAIHFYKKVEENGKYFPESCLGIAYAYFQLEEYSSAIPYFRKYISIGNKDKIHEAYTKLGDTYFKIKDFSNALIAYQSALEHGSIDFPHNSYHRALCLMELKRFGEADVILELFTERNNDHPYIDWANYQRAVLYYENRRKDLAVNVLSQIIDKKSDSKIIPFVLLRRGDIYAETTVYNRAVNDYKTIVEKFPATEVAEQALQRLQSLQMQGIPVPNLNYLISRLIRPQSSNPFSQNFEYRNAQVYYENGDYANAILTLTRLVQSAPKSESMNEVEYLLGQCYIAIGDIERAGIYLERSNLRQGLLKSAAIDFQIGFFQSAVSKYEKILKNYAEDNEKIDAKIGLIKSYFALKNYEKVMYYLDELKNSKSNFTQPVEHLYFGKIYLAQGQHEEAKDSFEKVIKLTNDAYAAEAQYLIGLIYREQGNYLSSNEELQKVKEKYQVHTIWVYESLFVIADNYLALDNLFQAKATLQWIMDNSQDAKLVNRAKEKLGEWDR
jgi:tetratricopeptide (TPR) repeat protein